MPQTPHLAADAPAVRVRRLSRAFGTARATVHALRRVDLDIMPGQLVMLVGPSGCGKTTLVSIISGVLDADEGICEVYGVDWASLSPEQRTARRAELVGFIFQQFNLIPTLDARENVAIPLLIRGMKRTQALDLAGAALAAVGLGERTTDAPSQLSGGMQQRVAIARALVGRPALLVCDEPTAALDARTGQSVMDLIQAASRDLDAHGRQRCIIVVTHDARIFHYADRIEEMEDGRIKTEPSEIIKQEWKWIPHYPHNNPHNDQPAEGA